MSWWYRSAVDAAARVPAASLLYPPLVELEAQCLYRSGAHTLFADEALGLDRAYWLPDFAPSGAKCFEWLAMGPQFGPGVLVMTQWLANHRANLMARRLLFARPPQDERKPRRPKIFKPTERQKAAAAKRRQGELFR